MEGLFQPLHLLLIIAIALLVFGTSKFAAVGKGLGEGIRNFKSAMKDPEADKKEAPKEEEKKSKPPVVLRPLCLAASSSVLQQPAPTQNPRR